MIDELKDLAIRFVFVVLVLTSIALSFLFYASNNRVSELKAKLEVEKEYNTVLRSDMYLLEISNMSYQMYIDQERHKGNIYEIETIENN